MQGITGFSIVPLKLATWAGVFSAVGAFVYATHFLVQAWLVGDPVRGFPTLIVSILLLGGLQLMATGILGEYIGRMFIESKHRPLYLIDEYQTSDERTDHARAFLPVAAAPDTREQSSRVSPSHCQRSVSRGSESDRPDTERKDSE